jgi:cell division protein ZapE
MPPSLRQAYALEVEQGRLRADPAQQPGLAALERLEGDLASQPKGVFFRKREALRGVYLFGPVGRGKSMLMDLFFRSSPVQKKRRTHFHVFMSETHRLVDVWRKGDAAARKARFGRTKGDDPIPPVAGLIADQTRLLCFDEFQVTDIADAMILGRLFEALFERGVTVVATSNRPPDDLYKDGLNRQLFLPFIDLLKRQLEVVTVAGPHDYRLDRLRAAGTWFRPIDPDNRRSFEALWQEMLAGEPEVDAELEVLGRRLDLPRTSGGLVRASFAALCEAPLGPADYLAIAERFHTLFMEDLPRLVPARRDAARRLNTLVDALYEARARLVVLAEAEPQDLYPAGDGAFEFERTVSRLQEMRSQDWLEDRS